MPPQVAKEIQKLIEDAAFRGHAGEMEIFLGATPQTAKTVKVVVTPMEKTEAQNL